MRPLSVCWLVVLPFILAVAPGEEPRAALPASCLAPASNARLITNLTTGQMLTDGVTTTLRFSSDARTCDAWSNDLRANGCHQVWTFNVAIPVAPLVPGAYDLAQLHASFGDLFLRATADSGCSQSCNSVVEGTGSVPLDTSSATLVIDHVDDACVSGVIQDLRDPNRADAPDFNGAFFAVPCMP